MELFKKAKLHRTTTRWYVSYSYLNVNTGRYKSFKKYLSTSYITDPQKEKRGREMVAKFNKRLNEGWNPIIDQELSLTNIVEAIEYALSTKIGLRESTIKQYRTSSSRFIN